MKSLSETISKGSAGDRGDAAPRRFAPGETVEELLAPKQFTSGETVEERIQLQESRSSIAHRGTAMRFLFWSYGVVLSATLTIIFFQGFKAWGFNLEPNFLNWLGAATIGEIGGLAALVYGGLFRKGK